MWKDANGGRLAWPRFCIVAMLLAGCASKPPLLDEDLRAGSATVLIAPTRLADGGWQLDSDKVKAMTTSAGALQGGAGAAAARATTVVKTSAQTSAAARKLRFCAVFIVQTSLT